LHIPFQDENAFIVRVPLQRLPLEKNSDDFVFDNQILTQILWLDCPIGEVTCPARYLPEASSINFGRSVRYGFGGIFTALEYHWAKIRGGGRLFPVSATKDAREP
jgi:hypothetical protein